MSLALLNAFGTIVGPAPIDIPYDSVWLLHEGVRLSSTGVVTNTGTDFSFCLEMKTPSELYRASSRMRLITQVVAK